MTQIDSKFFSPMLMLSFYKKYNSNGFSVDLIKGSITQCDIAFLCFLFIIQYFDK